jgi:ATP-binding cassette subfamily B protein
VSTFQWVIGYLKPYRRKLAWLIGCGLVMTMIELTIVRFVQSMIDDIIPGGQYVRLYAYLIVFVALAAIMLGAQAWRNLLQREIQEYASKDMILALFRQLRKLGFAYHEQHPAGETMGLFHTEVMSVQLIFRQYVPTLIQYSITLLILLIMILQLSWELSLWIIPFFLSYYVIGPYFEKKAAVWAKEANRERRTANKLLYDGVSALHEVRAYGVQSWSVSRLIHQYVHFHTVQLRQWLYAYMRGTVRRITTGLGAVAVFAYGIMLVQNGAMSVGEFVVYSIFYFRVMNVLTVLVTLTTEQKILLQQAEPLVMFVRQAAEVVEPESPVVLHGIRGEIEFKGVSFSYPTRPNVINHLSLHVRPGEKVALIGTSGGGKSTALKLIVRFYDPQEGEVQLDGVSVKQLSFAELRSSIGYVFQETYLFGGSVKDNIRFGLPDASDEEIIAASKAAYAHDFIEQLPQGYDTLVGERGIKLSGGQKQRIAIARMFIKNPSVVLLDEATSALDNNSEQEVQKALDSLLAGRTTIAVAHRLSSVMHYDRLIIIEEGANVEQGSYEELTMRGERFQQLIQGHVKEAGA